MNKKRFVLIGLAAVVACGLAYGGWYWWAVARFIESTDNAYVEADISVIAPKVAGYVAKMNVADNQAVKAGEILAEIDPSDYKAKLDQARATLMARRTALGAVDAQLQRQQAAISEADAGVKSARADLARTDDDLKRYRQLAASNYASNQKLETATADQRKARAALEKAAAGLSLEQNQTAVLKANRAEAEAQIVQAEADIAAVQLDLDNTVLRAPIDGVVGNRTGQIGQYVRAGTQMMVLVPLSDVYVTANFKETQLRDMKIGQIAMLHVDAFPNRTIKARIDSFAPASGAKFSLLPPENATGNFTKIVQRVPVRLRIEIEPGTPLLVPGMSVVVDVDLRSAGNTADAWTRGKAG
ncbi:HlyD family secretion protein [Ferrovibrio xuzhouensis]|uniref:HlyD family secretion protein n=1 Tax=Ferrovibrio xuzhouensis TaxID=1576914 RepID=A0ABV7VGM4_9PROT